MYEREALSQKIPPGKYNLSDNKKVPGEALPNPSGP